MGICSVSTCAIAFARRAHPPGLIAILLIGMWLAWMAPAQAASLSSRDVQIIAKALGFLEPPPSGGTVAIVYATGNAASKADALAIAAMFGNGLASGGGTLTGRAVDAAALGDGAGYVAIILAEGAEDNGSATSPRHGLLSISAADSLVRSGHCVMAVHSEPRVDITVNRAAARAAGIDFSAAFGMLVHEL